MSTNCKFAKLALNFDMSGKVQPCNFTRYYLENDKQDHFNVLSDDIKKIWNSEHRKKLISDHNNGIRNKTCQSCWDEEDAGIESARQRFNKALEGVEVLDSQPTIIVLKPGNKCNNACRSCNAHTSSMWYKTDYAIKNKEENYKEYLKFFHAHKTAYEDNKVLEKCFAEWEDNIILWDMYGGEPMIVPLFFKLLDQASENKNAKEKMFNVHTNGMVYKESLVEKFSKFKSAHIGFSVDAIGRQNDYIRYGSKWENILKNLKLYIQDCEKYENVSIDVRATITPWNVYYYDEIYNYFKNNIPQVALGGGWCHDKPWNDLRYLPQKVKDAVIEKLSAYQCKDKNWLETFEPMKSWIITKPIGYEKLQKSFINFNNKVDKIRKEKFHEVFPEYSKLFT